MPLAGKRIVLGVTGGIAAYKAIELCRQMVDAGAHVAPILTKGALHFVGETTFSALASEPVQTSLWTEDSPIPHTRLGQTADLIVVAPATARSLAAYATGMSDDLLTATLLATRAPVVVCPAMHTEMWEHPAVQANLEILRTRGVIIVDPESGRLAGGDVGAGRLASVEVILDSVKLALRSTSAPNTVHVEPAFGSSGLTLAASDGVAVAEAQAEAPLADLAGIRVLVTAGGTREPIDPVRFVGNRSSGRQGHAIAEAAAERGALVTLITTTSLPVPEGITRISVNTADEMLSAALEAAEPADLVVMTAAVADFRPAAVATDKLKKADGIPQIVLEPTVDILSKLGERKPAGQILVGFAAETSQVAKNATEKLTRKNCDLIVANDVSAPGVGFEHETNAVTIFTATGGSVTVPLSSKRAVAQAVLDSALAALNHQAITNSDEH